MFVRSSPTSCRDRICANITQCTINQYELALPTSSSDRTCAPLISYSGSLENVPLPVASHYINASGHVYWNTLTFSSLSLPLSFVGDYISIYNIATLTSITFAQLTYIGGNMFINANPALVTLSMPMLMHVGGNNIVVCQNNAAFVYPAYFVQLWAGKTRCQVMNGSAACNTIKEVPC